MIAGGASSRSWTPRFETHDPGRPESPGGRVVARGRSFTTGRAAPDGTIPAGALSRRRS